jgi:hypothetical protein
LYLVYALVNGGLSLLANIDTAQQKHIVVTDKQTDLLNDAKASSIRVEGYLRLVCVNTAKNPIDRSSCLSLR